MNEEKYTEEDKRNELRRMFSSLPTPISEELYEECLEKLGVEFSRRLLYSIMFPTKNWLNEVGGKELKEFRSLEGEFFSGSILRKVREERLVMEQWNKFL